MEERASELALTDFSQLDLVECALTTARTHGQVFKLRPICLGRKVDVAHVAIKNSSTGAALDVDQHQDVYPVNGSRA